MFLSLLTTILKQKNNFIYVEKVKYRMIYHRLVDQCKAKR